MRVEEALARMEIQEVLWRYARGVDRCDLDLTLSAYHPDATDHHAHRNGPAAEVVRDFLDRAAAVAEVGSHHITNIFIEFDGEVDARVESSFLSFHPHCDDAQVKMGIASGRYLDHFQRRGGLWKIQARRVVMDWTRDDFSGSVWPNVDGQPVQGRHKAAGDPAYAFFERSEEEARVTAAMTPQQLSDIYAIQTLKARYFRTMDTKQWGEFRDVFVDDLQFFMEETIMPASTAPTWSSADSLVDYLRSADAGKVTVHHGHMSEIDFVDDDTATGVWAMFDWVDDPGRNRAWQGYGHYHERYVRCLDGRWRIALVHLTRLRVDVVPHDTSPG